MSLYKHDLEGCHGGFTPEDKAKELAYMRENILSYERSDLLRDAEWIGILPDLLDFSAKELDQEKIDYISSSYSLLTQIENLIREDDEDKFTAFLIENNELIHYFPTCEVFSLLCWNNAPACVNALLDSPLRDEVDVNSFGIGEAILPLEVAASKLSLSLVQTLLDHGADANSKHGYRPTVLNSALAGLSSHERVKHVKDCTVKENTVDLVFTLRKSDMKEAVAVTKLLASHTESVDSVLSQLIDDRNFIEMTILLFAFKLLVQQWTFKDTLVAKFISSELQQVISSELGQVESKYDEMAKIKRKKCLNDAWMVAKFVWETCDKSKDFEQWDLDFEQWDLDFEQLLLRENPFKVKKKSKGKRSSSSSRPT